MSGYKLKVGLETHIELSTKSKMFCSCSASFGNEPNSNTCPVCLGLPGTLPVINKKALEYCIKMGDALKCDVSPIISMSRKNYIYPDLVKAYQITQDTMPLCKNGKYILSNGNIIRINRIHIEEDAGKLIHGNDGVLIDYNRASVPLIEIVTEPDFNSSDDVIEYLQGIRLIAKYLGISDCKMQEGSMRSDVNISVNSYERTEIKNMNSFSNISKAINAELHRQICIIENGGKIIRQTLRYDELSNQTFPMRSKENDSDYRYFPEPDIPRIHIDSDFIESVKSDKVILPDRAFYNLVNHFKLSQENARMISLYKPIYDFYVKLASMTGDYSMSCTVIIKYLFAFLSDDSLRDDAANLPDASYIAEVINYLNESVITTNLLKPILIKIFSENKPVSELFNLNELRPADNTVTEKAVIDVMDRNPKIVSDYKSGKTKAISALIGLVMKETDGRADANDIKTYIHKFLTDNEY